ncbi:MAG: glycosyltransferase [Clostridia bacterium]|nr:glycosyltransferase [Clostridia bacterium]
MKKILLVNKSFELGGIQSSMVNMANELSKHYEVHLFVYNPSGVMKERLNDKVKVLDTSWRFKCLGMTIKGALKSKSIKLAAFRVFAAVWSKLFTNKLPLNMAIKHQPKMVGYDLAIAYHQEQRKTAVVSGFARVVDRCVEAKKKVAWLHFDSSTIDLDSEFNNPFYQKMDKVVCVSKSLMENFANAHSELSDKMDYCYNFMLYDVIKEKSLQPQGVEFPSNKFVCFSACRLTEEKALVRGISAMSGVLKEHPEVVWYIAGDGTERNNIETAIKENSLEKQIVLIGHQSNPYPYIRNANLVLNLSYHEAAPMVFFESKALGTPVFATKTASATELLTDNTDSFICENSESGIRERFAWVVENRDAVEAARLNLEKYEANNDASVAKVGELIE